MYPSARSWRKALISSKEVASPSGVTSTPKRVTRAVKRTPGRGLPSVVTYCPFSGERAASSRAALRSAA